MPLASSERCGCALAGSCKKRVVRPSDTLTLVPLVGAVLSDDRGKRRSCGEHAREREYEAEAQQDGALHWQRQGQGEPIEATAITYFLVRRSHDVFQLSSTLKAR